MPAENTADDVINVTPTPVIADTLSVIPTEYAIERRPLPDCR